MRLFIAVQLSDEMKNAVISAQNTLRKNKVSGHFTDVQKLHLTLAFIGEYGNTDNVLEAMEQVHFKSFPLKLGGNIGSFGNLLWAGTEQNNNLEKLVRQLRHSLAEYHVPFDKKKFNPHITVLRNAVIPAHADISSINIDKAEMTVSEVSLMRSEHGKHGMIYTEIGSIVSDKGETV
jgi:2'-5' RNA ligase